MNIIIYNIKNHLIKFNIIKVYREIVPWGKDEKNFEKIVKRTWILNLKIYNKIKLNFIIFLLKKELASYNK